MLRIEYYLYANKALLTDLSWNLTKSIKQSEQIYGQNGGKTENTSIV